MGKVRVVLANMSQILTRILRDLVNLQPDMAVVGEVRTLADLPIAVASLHPQAVIVTFSPPSTGVSVCCTLRERYPTLTLLGLAPKSDRAVVWFPDASPQSIELSAGAIVSALRTGASTMQNHPATGREG
jgi:hypothetical protein